MAVVIEAKDLDDFIKHADKENLEATVVAEVSDNPRLVMYWRGEKIVDLARAFLNTNGVAQHTNITVKAAEGENAFDKVPECVNKATSLEQAWLGNLNRLNVCSQKGLSERFDSTIGRGTVLMPFGGKHNLRRAKVWFADCRCSMARLLPLRSWPAAIILMLRAGARSTAQCMQ